MFKRSIILAAALAPALPLGGCGGTLNRGLESVHQPVVSRTDYLFDVNADNGRLAPGEGRRLAGWMGSLRLGYGDRITVDDPSPYGSGVREDVAAEAARYGLLVSDDVPMTGAPVAPGTVRVIVSRSTASVPGCPDYSHMSQPEFNSNTSSNQGCAINSNLAMMVARPEDLVRGQPGSGTADPASATKAIEVYRKAPSASGSGSVKSGGGN